MKTVLIIDDEESFRALVTRWLTKDGWQVLEAADGEVGINTALQQRPDIVLCDLMMPRCNGFQVCRALRKESDLGHTKIIVTTGSDYESDRYNAFKAGADEYLVKPVDQRELVKLLATLLLQPPKTLQEEPARQKTDKPNEAWTPPKSAVGPADQITRVKFWGVRGSIPTPGTMMAYYGGNTSCIEVRADGQIIVLDAGTGIHPLGRQLAEEFKDQPINITLLISHTHWDHIQGFPFFLPAYNPQNHVDILGYEGAREGLESILTTQMESPYFPISMQQLPGNITIHELKDLKFSVGNVEIQAEFMNHPGICMGYRLFTSAGSIAYLPDNEPYQRFRYHSGNPVQNSTPEALAYAREQDQRLINFIHGADVLIIDSQYDATEYQTRIGWGHGCVDDVVALALSAKVKQLYLFHHDPTHDDAHMSRMVDWARQFVAALGETLPVDAAREGLEIVLQPAKPATASHQHVG